MGLTKRGSASVGIGCGLVVAAVIAFAAWPVDAVDGDDPSRPGTTDGASARVELTGSDDGSNDGSDDDSDDDSDDAVGLRSA